MKAQSRGFVAPETEDLWGCWQNGKIIIRKLLGAHFGHFGGQRTKLLSGKFWGFILGISKACWRNCFQEASGGSFLAFLGLARKMVLRNFLGGDFERF